MLKFSSCPSNCFKVSPVHIIFCLWSYAHVYFFSYCFLIIDFVFTCIFICTYIIFIYLLYARCIRIRTFVHMYICIYFKWQQNICVIQISFSQSFIFYFFNLQVHFLNFFYFLFPLFRILYGKFIYLFVCLYITLYLYNDFFFDTF